MNSNDKNQQMTRASDVTREPRRVNITPRARVRETPEAYELRMEMPGVSEQALRASIEERTLTVEAESETTPHEGYRLVREEFAPAQYRAMFEIPDRVDASGIKASLAKGVLLLTLPKREEVKPRRIEISAG